MFTEMLASCLVLAAQTYNVPPAVLYGIYKVEGGKVGMANLNTNGSYDLGPMQINTIWLGELTKFWRVNERTAIHWLKNDECTNVGVAAWILKSHLDETGSLPKAIAHYHSRTPKIGEAYRKRVVRAMHNEGLLTNGR
mgnify:CR=1 FL=1|jgi:soluble lytic murein transglycosylase-like protein|tara:strand:- start:288 stop:701 length:414 start_codon:yes stop_codon:yes gene_type:complete